MVKNYLLPGILLLVALAFVVFFLVGSGAAPLRDTPAAITDSSSPSRSFEGVLKREEKTLARASADSSSDASPVNPAAEVSLVGGGSDAVASIAPAVPAVQVSRDAKLEAISDAAYTFSPEGLRVLAPLLQDPDPEVRDAAIEGIEQLSVPEGITVFKQAAARARNEQERRRLIQAAEWLALPDWVEPSQRATNK